VKVNTSGGIASRGAVLEIALDVAAHRSQLGADLVVSARQKIDLEEVVAF